MVQATVLNPAITAAKLKDLEKRMDCATKGVSGVLSDFRTNSKVFGTNRKADGVGPIDTAVEELSRRWNPTAALAVSDPVEKVLKACAAWTSSRRSGVIKITGWRQDSIDTLYWETAWAYACQVFANEALDAVVQGNGTGDVTTIDEVSGTDPAGFNPYKHGTEYAHLRDAFQAMGIIYRGDTRGPAEILKANGFQARRLLDPTEYKPYFKGHAMGDTISTTDQQNLSINAVSAAHARGEASALGAVPKWIEDAIKDAGGQPRIRGFVYGINPGNHNATRVGDQPAGREEVFLAIPNGSISRIWAVLSATESVGPFPFPAPDTKPVGFVNPTGVVKAGLGT